MLCERLFQVFGDARFEQLAGIYNGHLYNLRQHKTYRSSRTSVDKTRPVRVNIGERRKPALDGQPGYLRVDSVHQGDLAGIKGLYLITAMDEATQFECVFAVERISEHFLIPALAQLLDKLRIEQTQTRARQTNDNALVESKNGSTVRKHLG